MAMCQLSSDGAAAGGAAAADPTSVLAIGARIVSDSPQVPMSSAWLSGRSSHVVVASMANRPRGVGSAPSPSYHSMPSERTQRRLAGSTDGLRRTERCEVVREKKPLTRRPAGMAGGTGTLVAPLASLMPSDVS